MHEFDAATQSLAETVLELLRNLAALDPKQVVSGAMGGALGDFNGEHIDMACHDLDHVRTVIEQPGVTAIERNTLRVSRRRSAGGLWRWRALKDRFVHSCATSFA